MKSTILVGEDQVTIDVYKDGAVGIVLSSEVQSNIRRFSTLGLKSTLPITAHLKDADGVLALFYLLDYIENNTALYYTLVLPYLPNARQDRITQNDVSLKPNTLKSFTNTLNKYSRILNVLVTDVHSEVSTSLLNRCVNLTQAQVASRIILEHSLNLDCIIAPDFGAIKKAKEISETINKPLGVALKTRDPISNELTETKILDVDVKGKNVVIVDDILDGGRTFINLAKELKKLGATSVTLIVTHGIFSYGYECLQNTGIDAIYPYFCWLSADEVNNSEGFLNPSYLF